MSPRKTTWAASALNDSRRVQSEVSRWRESLLAPRWASVTKYIFSLSGILEAGALDLILEIEGMGIVGEFLLEGFENGLVEFEAIGRIDKGTVVEGFVKGNEGGEGAEVVFDKVGYILLDIGESIQIDGVGNSAFVVVLGLGEFAILEQLNILGIGLGQVAEDEVLLIGIILELPEKLRLAIAGEAVGRLEVVVIAGNVYLFAHVGQQDDVVGLGAVDIVEGLVGHVVGELEAAFGIEGDGIEEDMCLGRHLFNIDGFAGAIFKGAFDGDAVFVTARNNKQGGEQKKERGVFHDC